MLVQEACKFSRFLIVLFSIHAFVLPTLLHASTSATESSDDELDPTESRFLIKAGENAKRYFYSLITERNKAIERLGYQFHFEVMDSRDRRLRSAVPPIRMPATTDLVVARVYNNGVIQLIAYLNDRPNQLLLREYPTGNAIVEIAFAIDLLSYTSRFDGLYGSITRTSNSAGWFYTYFLKGYGNAVTVPQFDHAIAQFLQNTVLYITPLQ